MNVLIVDDHALFRVGLEMLLTQLVPDIRLSQASGAIQAHSLITAGPGFDLVLLDLHMPDLAGIDALRSLRDALDHGRIVILSGDQSTDTIRQCIDHGASGFIPKDSTAQQLTEALHTVTQGRIYLPPIAQFLIGLSSDAASGAGALSSVGMAFPELTPRQCDVLRLTARGLTNKVIARALNISGDTVKQHLSLIYQVLGVRTRTEAVYMVSQRGIRIV